MLYLIDANVIIRFLIADHEAHFKESCALFAKIEKNEFEVHLLESVLMEVFFVLTKVYKLPKESICADLKKIISLESVINDNKLIFFETLSLLEYKSIDFVDALLCAKKNLEGFGILSFDSDVKKC